MPKDARGNFVTAQEKYYMVHDLLAFLAEQMLEMKRAKQSEIKAFLGFLVWLDGEVGANVEDLTPKTKIQEYYKLQFDELLAILFDILLSLSPCLPGLFNLYSAYFYSSTAQPQTSQEGIIIRSFLGFSLYVIHTFINPKNDLLLSF
jgi:hypothetical protein